MTGRFSGIGRIGGRMFAYVRWDDGRTAEFTLSAFRERFGVSATSLETGATVTERRSGVRETTASTCGSLWLSPSQGVKRVSLACFADYPYFFESFEQYGIELPETLQVRWKPIKPYLYVFSDEEDENPDFIAEVSGMILAGEPVPPLLVDHEGKLFDGRHRAWAAHDAGIRTVPVVTMRTR